ncbi:MAG: hypothetical protein ACP5VS_00485 [Desulfomonilaceae bacterium]
MKEEFKFRVNRKGEKIYTFDCIVDCKGLRSPYDQGESTEEINERIQEKAEEKNGEVELSFSNGPSPPTVPDDGKVRVLWRLVSGAKLWPSSSFPYPQCVDFGHDNSAAISRDIVPLIEASNPDIMWNHSVDSKDIAGSVEKPFWEAATEKLEGGINATLVVDPEYDPKAAKGLQSGIIRAGSIGVDGDYIPSHPNMAAQEFIRQQGKIVNGELVRWLPVKITAVRHMALVPAGLGADPMAGPRVALNNIQEVEPISNEKGGTMGSELTQLFSAVCKDLGVEVALSDGAPIPEMLESNLMGKIGELKKAQLGYSSIYDRVLRACELSGVKKYSGKSIDEILDVLPTDLANAENGVAFLEFQKCEALKAFDAAKVDPTKEELSDNDKKIRLRISSSQDIGYVQEALEEYKSLSLKRFGPIKTSADEEIPKVDIKEPEVSKDIVDSVSRLFGGRK